MESSLRIVAITNCPAGIAHTYMVAEALEQKARSLGHTIKVETQGSSGVENRLSSEEIAAADYVILATGRGLSGDDRARFAGKKVYEIAISQALKNIDQIFSELPTNSQLFAADSGVKLGKQEVQSGSVMSHLMAGGAAVCHRRRYSGGACQHAGAVRFAIYRYVERCAVVYLGS